jgi:hypothetical protein
MPKFEKVQVAPAGQLSTHDPAWQVCVDEQTLPQASQLLLSVCSSTQAPPQADKTPPQVKPHVPLLQVAVALAGAGQTWPQAPQLLGSLVTFVSQPSAASPLQSPNPALQVAISQVPLTQAGVACAAPQTWPHPPQLLMSLPPMLVSQPFAELPSQLAKPGLHVLTVQTPAWQVPVPFATGQDGAPGASAKPHVPFGLQIPTWQGSPAGAGQGIGVSMHVPLAQACVKHGSPLPLQVVWLASGPQLPCASQVLHSAHAIGPETQAPAPSHASPTVQDWPSLQATPLAEGW